MKHPEATQWQKLLERHDLTWEQVTDQWTQGGFIGNGMIGAMIYKDSPAAYRWELGRCDVLAHFQFPMVDWADPRVPIGDMLLEPAGKIESETMRLELWNAEVNGTIQTDRGQIQWRSIAHTDDMVIAIEIEATGGETGGCVRFRPADGVSPCMKYDYAVENLHKWNYDDQYIADHLPPQPTTRQLEDGTEVTEQRFLTGGHCVTGVRTVRLSERHTLTYVSIENSYPQLKAEPKALGHLDRACGRDYETWLGAHRQWWHAYYQQSFLSFSDTFWEGHYWIQMYKLASATRSDRALIDTQGPWLTQTPWPTCVWNLNVELSYSPVYTSNRLSLGESLCKTVDKNFTQLVLNVPDSYRGDCAGLGRASSCVEMKAATSVGWEVGNLTWVCHNYWRQYRASMDDEMLKKGLYPILRRAINFYLRMMTEDDQGTLHLPHTHSPEYGGHLRTRDANYDLALFRWGCQTLLRICERLKLDDELIPRWQKVLDKLAEAPKDDTVLRIGADLGYEISHRHYSHLFSIFPLHLLDLDQEENRKIALDSIAHWHSIEGNLLGYTWTGSAAMAAAMGMGDQALDYLNRLKEFLTPNTMYVENGPVIETPISAAESIHEMLLQSWGTAIKVFAAVPASWEDVSFYQLRAEGGFLISAVRRQGVTEWIEVSSLAGEPCRISCDIFKGPIEVRSDAPVSYEIDGLVMDLKLAKGQRARILSQGSMEPGIEPVEANPEYCHYFGMYTPDSEVKSRQQHT